MSQPPFPQQPPAAPGPSNQPPAAAPTQIGFPGQVQLAPQPQYAPTPQQAQNLQGGPLASGFPNYRSPQPSPPWLTGKIVGAIVVLLTIAFAVIGFLIVGGRGANSPEGAVEQWLGQFGDRDAGGVFDLTCESAQAGTSESEIESNFGSALPGPYEVRINGTEESAEGTTVRATVTAADGQSTDASFLVVEEKGWRVCGSDTFTV